MSKQKSYLVPTYLELCNLQNNKFAKHIEIKEKKIGHNLRKSIGLQIINLDLCQKWFNKRSLYLSSMGIDYKVFIDLEKLYDEVPRETFWKAMDRILYLDFALD